MDNDVTSAGPGSTPTGGPRLDRRRLLTAAVATAGIATVATGAGASPAAAAGNPHPGLPDDLARRLATPGLATAAGFRWWWPHGAVDPAQIKLEVQQIAAAGFGAVEIADVTHSLRARDIEIPLATQGWGTRSWVDGVKAALGEAGRRGVRVDITVGPSWPAAVPTLTPDDEGACAELVHGRVALAAGATYDDALPEPVVEPVEAATVRTLVGVQAARVVTPGTARAEAVLDLASVVELTDEVVDGRLTWTAPAGSGSWELLAYWQRGSGQEPEAGPHTDPRCWVVDHFSPLGSQAVIDLWESTILDDELRRLLRSAGGYLFEDSLEIETEATIWTPRFLEEFAERRGYDLRPYLACVLELHERYQFAFDATTTIRVRDDVNQTISDLYRDHHLKPIQEFARTLDMGLRVQPYGLETDTVEHSAVVDVPETESLGFKNLDDYRVMAGGRDLGGRTVLSCEAACYNGGAYSTTWERALQTIHSIYAAGVNMAVLHGFAHATAPGVTWPGFAAFSPYYNGAIGFGEAWGPRTPLWQHMPGIAAHLARTQLVLQTGVPKYDVVFLRPKGWASTGIGAPWATNDGIPLGWTHGFATPALLDLPLATVRDGRLAPDGPAYKVMIVGPDQFRGNRLSIELSAARRVRALAEAGLKVVLMGDWANLAEPVGVESAETVAQIRAEMAAVAALPTTRTVGATANADVPGALAALGVTPDVTHERSTVMSVRRVLAEGGGVDLYYLANAKHAENRRLTRVTQDVWLTATRADAVPYRLDTWSGTLTPVAFHERSGSKVRVRVDLQPGQSTVVVLAAPARSERPVSVVATTAEAVSGDERRIVVRSSTAGRHTVTLAGGRTKVTTIASVRAPLTLGTWDLEVEDWTPGRTATTTTRTTRRTRVEGLRPWSQIPGLEDVSGIGRYSVTIDLGQQWPTGTGALLELGAVEDTFRVSVNGQALPPCDPLVTTVDLGRRLRRGRNTIQVEVASTLLNRLRTVTPEVYGVATRQNYGLLGPVRLVPYVEQEVR
ncbi:alpha-L-rhamnosidase [Nocardioides sp. ChNu-153]|uniref:glycosyl hydrolase n=1 Tax=Nocardioides sp. ChNu-153 TaxID=2779364 RepID=UPI00264AA0D9|nr:glycosyl hydrolase [Nocardioides sp. ChNu-153]MDN7122418.1 alpha-L-rhamnosidase [Nocardioides sp. ChNu-153]